MELLLFVLLIAAVTGVALTRWTRVHPLLAAAIIALTGGCFGILATAGLLGANPGPVGAMAMIVFGFAGALGAFMGWLRRKHIERIS